MASFNGNINLLGFVGAKLLSGIDEKNPQRGFVCIPIDLNEVKVTTGNSGQRATARVNMWPTSDALFNSAVNNAIQRGENPPTRETFQSHTLDLSLSNDFVKSMIKAYGQKLIDKVIAANPKHPEYAQMNANDETTPLFKAVRGYMQPRLANMFVNRKQEGTSAQPVVMQTAQGVTGYVAPAPDADPFAYIASQEDSDLPF